MIMAKIDTATLLAQYDVVDVVGRYVQLNKDGAEYSACCPFHDEGSPSFKVNKAKQFYHCFGCGAHGDAIRFVMEYRGLGFKDAVGEITNGNPPTTFDHVAPKPPKEEDIKEWQPVMPVPDDVPPAPRTFTKRIKGEWTPLDFAGMWDYRDQQGALLGHVSRFEWQVEGVTKKDYFPLTWCRNTATGELKWKYQAFTKPRPLYNLPDLVAKPDAVVLVHEGEKKVDAGGELVPALAHVAWSGGGKAVKNTAWEPLRGRKVLIWRDADQPGLEAAESVALAIQGIAAAVKIIDPPEGVASGWDMADAKAEGWTGDQVKAHVRTAARAPLCVTGRVADPEEPPPHDMQPMHDYDGYDDDEAQAYRPLGYDHGRYYYLAGRAAQVIDLASSSHTKLNMLSIAPLQYWEQSYPGKGEPVWDMAANALMRQCEKAGVYDPNKVRGRGAWWDDGRSLLHVGDRLIVDGKQLALTDRSVKYVYEAAPSMHFDMENPLTAREAHEFIELCKSLQWEKPISGTLLAGWIFMAPVCGALTWRPHIWITGGAGTGKSWVQTNIVSKLLESLAVTPQGGATEAGIRQTLGMDARPVVFDEAEGEDQQAQARIQSIMALARQASSENGGAIVKGSATGKATAYRIRSMFAFSSIGVGVQQYADKTRVSVLALQVDQRKSEAERSAHFKELEQRALKLLTPEYCARFRARAVNMIATIRENARTFSAAGAAVIGTQRLGDQIGTMLAGAYALHKNGLISAADARAWVEGQDWSEENAMHERKDEMACLSHILEHVTRIGTVERSVGELISLALGDKHEDAVGKLQAGEHLLRIGVKVEMEGVKIANTHTSIAAMLRGTLWAREWGRILKRIDDAEVRKPERFGSGGTHRCVIIPYDAIEGR